MQSTMVLQIFAKTRTSFWIKETEAKENAPWQEPKNRHHKQGAYNYPVKSGTSVIMSHSHGDMSNVACRSQL